MKRKLARPLALLLLLGISLWYRSPMDWAELDHHDVFMIVLYNKGGDKVARITEEEHLQHIVENLNKLQVRRSTPSWGQGGYVLKMTIYLSDGHSAEGLNHFMINGATDLRKGSFCYSVTKGAIDLSYLMALVS